MVQNKPKVVIVLSAPRSGSSALTSLLIGLGMDPGSENKLVPADEFNKLGFFENSEINKINEALIRCHLPSLPVKVMDRLNITHKQVYTLRDYQQWFFCRQPLPENFQVPEEIQRELSHLQKQAARSKFITIWKDPRFCFTLPVWKQYIEPICVVLWRNPTEMAESFSKMTQLPVLVGEIIWTTCSKAAFDVSRSCKRIVINYHDLIYKTDEITRTLKSFFDQLGVKSNSPSDEIAKRIDINQYRCKLNLNSENPLLVGGNLLKWLTSGARENPPTEELVSLSDLAILICTLCTINSFEQKEQNMIHTILDQERKLDRVRKIPLYRFFSGILNKLFIK